MLALVMASFQSFAQWAILENYDNYRAFPLNVNSLAKDSKGNIYAGGAFKNDSGNCYVAKWDGKIWSELGGRNTSVFKNTVSSIVTDASGNLYAAGEFVNANGKYYVAKWDGTGWSELGGANTSVFNSGIIGLAIDANGNIYAGGRFTNAKGKQFVAKWDGTNWSELGGANTSAFNGAVKIVCADASGNVYATGSFTNASSFMYIAKWNGNGWAELSGANNPFSRAEISAMTLDANGNLYAGGMFMNAKSKVYVAKWNGGWSELGGKDSTDFNISNTVKINNLAVDATGNVCVGVGSGSTQYVRLWKANRWNSLGGVFLNPTKSIITDDAGNIYATGLFKNNVGNFFVNKWDGHSWGELGVKGIMTLFPQGINSVVTDASGNVYAAPRGTNDSGKNYVAKWNGSSWSEVGGKDRSTFNGWVNSLCFDTKGNLYAGGYFTNGKGKNYVAKWDGTSWQELAWPIDSVWNRRILTLAPDTKGNVYAVTEYFVKKWNGTIWNTLDSGLFAYNGAIAIDANNNIYAVENGKTVSKYSTAGNGGFLELGGAGRSTFNGTVNNLILDAADGLYAMGNFTNSNGKRYVAKWNGSSWNEVGGNGNSTFNNQIFGATIDKRSNLYVAGFFKNDSAKNYVAKWNGSNWSELGGKNTSAFSNTIYTLANDVDGNVFTGGVYSIKTASDYTSYVAKYTNSLPATLTLGTFTAQSKESKVVTKWQTATETNTARFHLQRSTNGTEGFANIATLQAAGNSDRPQDYAYIDQFPLQGTNYYRLETVDKDGSSSYSKTVSVSLTTDHSPLITISPNPARSVAVITLAASPKARTVGYRLITPEGKPALSGTAALPAGKNSFRLNLSAVSKGSYRLVVEGNGEKQLIVE